MNAVWLTDLHLEMPAAAAIEAFFAAVSAARPDVVLISGDLAQARSVYRWLRTLATRLARPIYFVLGNHDYYGGAIAQVRRAVKAEVAGSQRLCWLDLAGVVSLTPRTALIGHGRSCSVDLRGGPAGGSRRFLITAYPTDAIKEGVELWPK